MHNFSQQNKIYKYGYFFCGEYLVVIHSKILAWLYTLNTICWRWEWMCKEEEKGVHNKHKEINWAKKRKFTKEREKTLRRSVKWSNVQKGLIHLDHRAGKNSKSNREIQGLHKSHKYYFLKTTSNYTIKFARVVKI